MISVSGTNIKVSGASGHSINANGAKWWDGKGSNGGKTKPKFFYAHSLKGTSSITGLNVLNTPVQAFSVDSAQGLSLVDITIDNSAGDTNSLGHNTDAFDVGSSSNIVISGANVKNQDDCLAINSGTDITFTGGTCSGGHGLSIGSVGGRSDNTVSGITISSSKITNSANGVRIKTVSGATGEVSDVTYKDINGENHFDTIWGFQAQIFQHEIDHLLGVEEKIVDRDYKLPIVKEPQRNDKCLCGSGKKYKHCCLKYLD